MFEGCTVGGNISWVADVVAADGDAGMIRIILISSYFTYHHGVEKILLFMERNVVIIDEKEGVSARNLFGVGG